MGVLRGKRREFPQDFSVNPIGGGGKLWRRDKKGHPIPAVNPRAYAYPMYRRILRPTAVNVRLTPAMLPCEDHSLRTLGDAGYETLEGVGGGCILETFVRMKPMLVAFIVIRWNGIFVDFVDCRRKFFGNDRIFALCPRVNILWQRDAYRTFFETSSGLSLSSPPSIYQILGPSYKSRRVNSVFQSII